MFFRLLLGISSLEKPTGNRFDMTGVIVSSPNFNWTRIKMSKLSSHQSVDHMSARSPGRPKRKSGLKEKILDEAELAFAEFGFAGTTTREIAGRAGVNQNLVRYYFESKQALFDEVIRRRGQILSGERHVTLDRLIASKDGYSLEDLIRTSLQPSWNMKHSGPGGAAFIRLQARIHAEPDEHSLKLRREIYDAAVKRYIEAVGPILPELSRETISVRWTFLVGTYLFMLNDLGRIEDISDGLVSNITEEELLDSLVIFLSQGFKAPATL